MSFSLLNRIFAHAAKGATTAFVAVAAALAVVGCTGTSDDEPDAPVIPATPERAISFRPDTGNASRADDRPLSDIYDNFAVRAWKYMPDDPATADDESLTAIDVLAHADHSPYEVHLDDTDWVYDFTSLGDVEQYLKYWDHAATRYAFTAYAPYRIIDQYTLLPVKVDALYDITVRPEGTIKIDNVLGNVDATVHPQWLIADYQRENNSTAEALTATVPLQFRHITPLVEVRAYNAEEDAILTITEVYVNFKQLNPDFNEDEDPESEKYLDAAVITNGNFDSAASPEMVLGTATGSQLINNPSCSFAVAGSDREHSTLLAQIVELPQEISDLYVEVRVKTRNKEYLGYFPLAAPAEKPFLWQPNKLYTYYIILNDRDEIILVDLNVEEYRWRQGNDIDEDENLPLPNW